MFWFPAFEQSGRTGGGLDVPNLQESHDHCGILRVIAQRDGPKMEGICVIWIRNSCDAVKPSHDRLPFNRKGGDDSEIHFIWNFVSVHGLFSSGLKESLGNKTSRTSAPLP